MMFLEIIRNQIMSTNVINGIIFAQLSEMEEKYVFLASSYTKI